MSITLQAVSTCNLATFASLCIGLPGQLQPSLQAGSTSQSWLFVCSPLPQTVLVVCIPGGSSPAEFDGANGLVSAQENGNCQLHEDTGSEASDHQPPPSPEPELDQYDHERPIDLGPVASSDQVGSKSQTRSWLLNVGHDSLHA